MEALYIAIANSTTRLWSHCRSMKHSVQKVNLINQFKSNYACCCWMLNFWSFQGIHNQVWTAVVTHTRISCTTWSRYACRACMVCTCFRWRILVVRRIRRRRHHTFCLSKVKCRILHFWTTWYSFTASAGRKTRLLQNTHSDLHIKMQF